MPWRIQTEYGYICSYGYNKDLRVCFYEYTKIEKNAQLFTRRGCAERAIDKIDKRSGNGSVRLKPKKLDIIQCYPVIDNIMGS